MKRLLLIPTLMLSIFIIECQNQDKTVENMQTNGEIFEAIIQGNEKYGNKKENTCKSVFKCEVSQINENVIMAPTWEPQTAKRLSLLEQMGRLKKI